LQETVIPDDKSQVTAFSVIENQLNEQLRVIINEPSKDEDIEPFKNVKKLYKACFNTDLIESRGITPVTNVLNAMGGWPVISTTWNEGSWTWQQSVFRSKENGYSVSNFLSFSVSTDNKDTTKRIIRVIEDKKST
jgi:neprilysin